jgi:hypothetical protein
MPDKEKDLFKTIAEENQWEGSMTLGQRFLGGSQGLSSTYYYPTPQAQTTYPGNYTMPQSSSGYDRQLYHSLHSQPGPPPDRIQSYSVPSSLVPNQYPSYAAGSELFDMFVHKDHYDQHQGPSSQATAQSAVAQSLTQMPSGLVNIPEQIPPAIPMKLMFSASGFDVVSALVKMATRENPKVSSADAD